MAIVAEIVAVYGFRWQGWYWTVGRVSNGHGGVVRAGAERS